MSGGSGTALMHSRAAGRRRSSLDDHSVAKFHGSATLARSLLLPSAQIQSGCRSGTNTDGRSSQRDLNNVQWLRFSLTRHTCRHVVAKSLALSYCVIYSVTNSTVSAHTAMTLHITFSVQILIQASIRRHATSDTAPALIVCRSGTKVTLQVLTVGDAVWQPLLCGWWWATRW